MGKGKECAAKTELRIISSQMLTTTRVNSPHADLQNWDNLIPATDQPPRLWHFVTVAQTNSTKILQSKIQL